MTDQEIWAGGANDPKLQNSLENTTHPEGNFPLAMPFSLLAEGAATFDIKLRPQQRRPVSLFLHCSRSC